MAIKDQCSKCSKSRGSICSLTNAMPSFDQTSCQNYTKAGINLDKGSQPSSGSTSSSSGAIPAPPPLPSGYNPSFGESTSSPAPHKQRMFSAPFSFDGRIRRLEYFLSGIIFYIYALFAGVIAGIANIDTEGIMVYVLLAPGYWFLWAQGAKRCHDRNNSGWYQLIPFYGLWMLFADGDEYENDYGTDPKGRELYS